MKIQIILECDNYGEAQDVVARLAGNLHNVGSTTGAAGTKPEPAEEKPKRVRRTNAQIAADKAAAEAAAAAAAKAETADEDVSFDEPAGKSVLTYDEDVRPVLMAAAQAAGNGKALQVLNSFGVSKGKDLKPDQFEAAIAAFDELVHPAAEDADEENFL